MSATCHITLFRFDHPGSSATSDLISAGATFVSTSGAISLALGFAGFTWSPSWPHSSPPLSFP
jgi:hypothetical protein